MPHQLRIKPKAPGFLEAVSIHAKLEKRKGCSPSDRPVEDATPSWRHSLPIYSMEVEVFLAISEYLLLQ
jgi:hypothetical protein